MHIHWSKVWWESPSNLLRGKQAWQMLLFIDRFWSFKLGCFYFQFQFLKEQYFIQVSRSHSAHWAIYTKDCQLKIPQTHGKRREKIFVLDALKFWNLEKVFGLCAEKGKSICIRHPELPPKGVYPATTLSMVNRYNRYCTMILLRMINITRLEVSGKYAATSLQTMGDYSIRYNRQLAQKKQSNLLLFQILKILYHTEVNWNMLLENHHQRF